MDFRLFFTSFLYGRFCCFMEFLCLVCIGALTFAIIGAFVGLVVVVVVVVVGLDVVLTVVVVVGLVVFTFSIFLVLPFFFDFDFVFCFVELGAVF